MITPPAGAPLTEFDLVEIEREVAELAPRVRWHAERFIDPDEGGDNSLNRKPSLFECLAALLDVLPALIEAAREKERARHAGPR